MKIYEKSEFSLQIHTIECHNHIQTKKELEVKNCDSKPSDNLSKENTEMLMRKIETNQREIKELKEEMEVLKNV